MRHKPVKAHETRKSGNKTCQRCGDGTYMAKHENKGKTRHYCGKCHMTIFE